MRRIIMAALAATAATTAVAAQAQDMAAPTTMDSAGPGSLAGFRLEGDVGWDRQHALGERNDRLGYGGSAGFDGNLTDRVTVGPEFAYWHPDAGRNLVTSPDGTAQLQSGDTYSVAVRVGYRLDGDLTAFAQGGYARQFQRTYALGVETGTDHVDGYEYGGGLQYSPHDRFSFVPANAYVSARYVRERFDNHTTDEHAMAGFGIRFR